MASVNDQMVNKVAICSAFVCGAVYVSYSFVKRVLTQNHKTECDSQTVALYHHSSSHPRLTRRLSGTTCLVNNSNNNPSSPQSHIYSTLPKPRKKGGKSNRIHYQIPFSATPSHFAEAIMLMHRQQFGIRTRDSVVADPFRPVLKRESSNELDVNIDDGSYVFCRRDSLKLRTSRRPSVNMKTDGICFPTFLNISGDPLVTLDSQRSVDNDECLRSLPLRMDAEKDLSCLSAQIDDSNVKINHSKHSPDGIGTSECDFSSKILNESEARGLVAILSNSEELRRDVLKKTLVTISNLSAFTQNQNEFGKAGCIHHLADIIKKQKVIDDDNDEVVNAALVAISNLSLNVSNQCEMESVVPLLLEKLSSCLDVPSPSLFQSGASKNDALKCQIISTLTNISTLSNWHHKFNQSLSRLIKLCNSECEKLSSQALRLMINLSTNECMLCNILSIDKDQNFALWRVLEDERTPTSDEMNGGMMVSSNERDRWLRILSLISNITCFMKKVTNFERNIAFDADHRDRVVKDYCSNFFDSPSRTSRILLKLRQVIDRHSDSTEICSKAMMVLHHLNPDSMTSNYSSSNQNSLISTPVN